ncbi:MAG: response regulator transcription factor [Rhodospirillales bacterium]|nr:response regulator transcription factor [Alphaproteobacteria bacterium]MBL6948577.1 response regulator transcription factor [Rhodospirillales bacterium]
MRRDVQVYVIDDDEAVRRSLCWLVESADHPARAFASADEFLSDLPETDGIGCIVTDVRMPGMSGVELLEELALRGNNLPVVVITGHGDVQMAVEAMRRGALDFVEKPFEEKALLEVIERAIAESEQRNRTLSEDADVRKRFKTLTPRECEVLKMILSGRPNRRVAKTLGISEKTVEVHRAHIMEKTGAESFAELVTMAVQSGFQPGPQQRK